MFLLNPTHNNNMLQCSLPTPAHLECCSAFSKSASGRGSSQSSTVSLSLPLKSVHTCCVIMQMLTFTQHKLTLVCVLDKGLLL